MTFVEQVRQAGNKSLLGNLHDDKARELKGREALRLLYCNATDDQLSELATHFAEKHKDNPTRWLALLKKQRELAQSKEQWDAAAQSWEE